MRVRANVSFTGRLPDGSSMPIEAGQEFTLPRGVDWLEAGLVEAVEKPKAKQKPKANKKRAED